MESTALDTPEIDAAATPEGEIDHDMVVEELLVEEISIDGMCGVY